MVEQVVLAQEVQAGSGIRIVLVSGGLTRLRLDVELAGEADLLLVIHSHVQQAGKVIDLTLHVGVPERGVAFAATPEGVAFTTEAMRDVHGLLHLSGGIGEHASVRACRCTLAIARMGEEAGSAPEKLLAGLLLCFFKFVSDGVKGGIALGQRGEFGGHVTVMPAVVVHAELVHELKAGPHAALRIGDGVAAVIPRALGGAATERIGQRVAHGVPVGDRKAHLRAHRFATDDFVRVVVLEGESVAALGSFVLNFRDVRESVVHGRTRKGDETGRSATGS